jgi:succinate dehydrogenase/fumarate reductase flavoprotein subunit
MAKRQVAVVGGGLGGLMTVIKLAEAGVHVDLFSLVPVKRSHSVCAQGGINGAVNTKGEGDSPWIHFDDTIYGGDFLANQPPVLRMCERAPAIIYLLDRMGVPFNRTPEGLLDFRRFGGTRHHRTAFAGSTTGQQLLYALDEQVRRWEVEGRVTKYEGWEFIGLVLDDAGICRVDWSPKTCARWKSAPSRRGGRHRHRGTRHAVQKHHQLHHLHGQRCQHLLSARGVLCQRRVHPDSPDPPFRARISVV